MHRIGCVSYLNAKPLIFGLEQQPDIQLDLEVPAKLLDGLLAQRFEVALLPVIDYQRMENLALLPAGGIGSEDETLTVRIFSSRPIEQIRTLSCDIESHTSVALARIILQESFGIHPEFVPSPNADAQLLIGDKVIARMQTEMQKPEELSPSPCTQGEGRGGGEPMQNAECRMQNENQETTLDSAFCIHHSAFSDNPLPTPPPVRLCSPQAEYKGRELPEAATAKNSSSFIVHRSSFQLDLGSAWRKLTGLPFLFACWTARQDASLGDLPQRLLAARKRGMENIPKIVQRDAIPLGWPAEVARKYLTEHLSYEVSPRQIQAVELFHQLAARHGLIPAARPLEILSFNAEETL
jgi:predicted solute-binding protein